MLYSNKSKPVRVELRFFVGAFTVAAENYGRDKNHLPVACPQRSKRATTRTEASVRGLRCCGTVQGKTYNRVPGRRNNPEGKKK